MIALAFIFLNLLAMLPVYDMDLASAKRLYLLSLLIQGKVGPARVAPGISTGSEARATHAKLLGE